MEQVRSTSEEEGLVVGVQVKDEEGATARETGKDAGCGGVGQGHAGGSPSFWVSGR